MIQLREKFWVDEIIEGSRNLRIDAGENGKSCLVYEIGAISYDQKLPKGTWEIVCTSKEAMEAIASQIVEKDGDVFYKCYAGKRSHISPLRSLFCLMDERGCDMNNNWLILKKQ
jgi:hypothetical protein